MPDPNGPYGDQQAQMTMNRAAYGDIPSAMMGGAGTIYGGAGQGINNMFTQLGSNVFPTTYTPPARVWVGYGGMYTQSTGLIRGMFGQLGLESVPRGTTALEHAIYTGGDIGERVGVGGAAAGLSAAGLAFGMTAGAAVGGFMGGAVGSVFGPAGTAVGAFLGRELGGYAMGMAGSNAIMGAVNQRRDMESFLEASSFRFTGAGNPMADPLLGGGMSREVRRQTAEFVRGQGLRDPLFSAQEMTEVLQGSTQMGLFNGTQDMKDFQDKFKSITESVKQVTRVLHQTLQEGLKTIKDLRAIGVDPSQAGSVAQQVDVMGRMAGKTGAEMMGLGLQGAEMFRGTGVNMGVAFQATIMNNAANRAARDAGLISQETIAQAGGEEALAQRQTASGLAFGQSAFGRGMGGAFFNPAAGPAGFNQAAFMSNVMSGGGNFIQNAQSAANNLGNPAALIKYEANQEKFLSEMGKAFGGQGLQFAQVGAAISQGAYLAQQVGGGLSTSDASQLIMKQMGMGRPEIDAALGRIQGAGAIFQASQASASATRNKMEFEEAAQSMIFNRMGQKIKNAWGRAVDVFANPINQGIDAVASAAVQWKEENVYGIRRASAAGIDFADLSEADLQRARTTPHGPVDISHVGALNSLFGIRNGLLSSIESGGLAGIGITTSDLGSSGNIVLRSGRGSGAVRQMTMSDAQLAAAQERATRLNATTADVDEAVKAGKINVTDIQQKIGAAAIAGKLNGAKNAEDYGLAIFGHKNMSRDEYMALMAGGKGNQQFDAMFKSTAQTTGATLSAVNSMSVEEIRQLRGQFDKGEGAISSLLNVGKLGAGVATKLAEASMLEKSGKTQEADRLRQEAAGIQIAAGMPASDATRLISASKTSGFAKVADGFINTAASIAVAEDSRGSTALAESIRSEAANNDNLGPNRDKVLSIAAKLEHQGIDELSKEDLGLLNSTGVGKGITAEATKLRALPGILKGGDDKAIRAALREAGVSGAQVDALARKAEAQGGDINSVVSEVRRQFNESAGGGANIQSSATGGKALEAGGATAQQTFAQQTAINSEILAALTAMAAKLKGGK